MKFIIYIFNRWIYIVKSYFCGNIKKIENEINQELLILMICSPVQGYFMSRG